MAAKKETKPNLTVTSKDGEITVHFAERKMYAETPHNNRVALVCFGKTLDSITCKIAPVANQTLNPFVFFQGGKLWIELRDAQNAPVDITSDWEVKFYIHIK
jgi:hypothetical protein